MSRRRKISFKTKYAAALLKLGDVPYEHAKLMHEDQIISLYDVHHNKLHATDQDDHFSNIEPMLRPEHKARFAKDNAAAKRATRLARVSAEASRRLLAKDRGEPPPTTSRWPKRKLQSRNAFQRRST
jgi:hypothetical protein